MKTLVALTEKQIYVIMSALRYYHLWSGHPIVERGAGRSAFKALSEALTPYENREDRGEVTHGNKGNTYHSDKS